MKTAVNLKNISYSYEKSFVLKDLSFSVPKGDFFIVIGANGSGKTTLMKIMSGIIKTKKGNLEIFGRPAVEYSRRDLAGIIAFVPQTIPLDFPFTVKELVLMGRSPYLGLLGLEQEKDVETAQKAIEFTGIEHLAARKLDQLSGGERQRVFIARAICQESKIIILDEPTASLDLAHQVRVMDLMEKLKTEKNTTVIMVSHDVNLAAMYGDHLLLLKNGRIISFGRPEEVLTFETLEKAYGCTLLVDESPLGKFPRVTPVPGKFMQRTQS